MGMFHTWLVRPGGEWNKLERPAKFAAIMWVVFLSLGTYWFLRTPTSGKAIGVLAVASAVMAAVMEKLKWFAKVCWVLLMFGLLFIEVQAIDNDRTTSDNTLKNYFNAMSSQASNDLNQLLSDSEKHFGDTIKDSQNSFQQMLNEEDQHFKATMNKQNQDFVETLNEFQGVRATQTASNDQLSKIRNELVIRNASDDAYRAFVASLARQGPPDSNDDLRNTVAHLSSEYRNLLRQHELELQIADEHARARHDPEEPLGTALAVAAREENGRFLSSFRSDVLPEMKKVREQMLLQLGGEPNLPIKYNLQAFADMPDWFSKNVMGDAVQYLEELAQRLPK